MSSGPNIPDARRKRKPRRLTLSPDVNAKLDHLVEQGVNISALVDRALRKELGLPPEHDDD